MTRSFQRILIIGAGGHAKVAADAVLRQGTHALAGFVVDDRAVRPDESLFDAPLIHLETLLARRDDFPRQFIVGIGDNAVRRAKTTWLIAHGFEPVPVIHPAASIGRGTTCGPGTLVCAGALLDPDVEIGAGVILNAGAVVTHDSRIGDFTHLAPGATFGGGCVVGSDTFVGMGAIVVPRVRIGNRVFVTAGSMVTEDVPDSVRVVGRPARVQVR